MSDDNRLYTITGSAHLTLVQGYELVRGSPVYRPRQASVFKSSSLEIYQGARFRDLRQRKLLRRVQLDQTASDSWTQHRTVGSSQAFVIQPISSSRHEVVTHGCFFSGTQGISAGSIPASGSLFYEKNPVLKTSVYKWVASASMHGFSAGNGQFVNSTASVDIPHSVIINVPDSGRIVDVKVWVDVLQVSGTGHPPLGQFSLAVRSPNVMWGHAHPIRNYNDPLSDEEYGSAPNHSNPYETPTPFYRDSYLLWEAGGLFRHPAIEPYDGDEGDFGTSDTANRCPTWDRDRGMRTVFCDGSSTPNPRNIINAVKGAVASPMDPLCAISSPNAFSASFPSAVNPKMLGNGVPWYSDPDMGGSDYLRAGSPPYGWRTGPGGTADTMEFDSTGSNWGPVNIQPLYPLMDDVLVRKMRHTSGMAAAGATTGPVYIRARWEKWEFIRPGLRGKEMQGDWRLMIANSPSGTWVYTNTYLRQWRLEITYEQVSDTVQRAAVRPKNRPRKSGCVPYRPGFDVKIGNDRFNLISIISGSTYFNSTSIPDLYETRADYHLTAVYVRSGYELENGRTIGVTHSTSSLEYLSGDFAVYTGSVAMTVNTSSYDRADIIRVLDPDTLLGGPKTLSTVIRSAGNKETTEAAARRILSGTL